MPDNSDSSVAPWWETGVIYQIYPRSFADSNGDGVGDLRGIIDHLPHLVYLGVDGIWLSPVTVSPNRDFGYDVADYCDIDPDYGTLADIDELIAKAGEHDIHILLDLVPNHTSDEHQWFIEARSSKDSPYRDYYVWADPAPDGGPPNNWMSCFGGGAWQLDEQTGQYYLHNFEYQQPDLNWWSPDVHQAFEDILAFWWDRGVAGFRVDVANMMVKDAELRDNPPADENDPFVQQAFGQKWKYNSNRPETLDIHRRWRELADAADPPRMLVGETSVEKLTDLVRFYGDGTNGLNLCFNFPFIESPFQSAAMRQVVEDTERLLPRPGLAGVGRQQSRLLTAGHTLGRRRPGQNPLCASHAAHPSRDTLSLPRR